MMHLLKLIWNINGNRNIRGVSVDVWYKLFTCNLYIGTWAGSPTPGNKPVTSNIRLVLSVTLVAAVGYRWTSPGVPLRRSRTPLPGWRPCIPQEDPWILVTGLEASRGLWVLVTGQEASRGPRVLDRPGGPVWTWFPPLSPSPDVWVTHSDEEYPLDSSGTWNIGRRNWLSIHVNKIHAGEFGRTKPHGPYGSRGRNGQKR